MSNTLEELEEAVQKQDPIWVKQILNQNHVARNNGNSPQLNEMLSRILGQELKTVQHDIDLHTMGTRERDIVLALVDGGATPPKSAESFIERLRHAAENAKLPERA